MSKMDKYLRHKFQKNKPCVKSVSILPEQDEFLKRNGLNLSSMVRDMIWDCMADLADEEPKKKKKATKVVKKKKK